MVRPGATATVLSFEPHPRLTNAPAGTVPAEYGQRVAAPEQDGFTHGPTGDWTPDLGEARIPPEVWVTESVRTREGPDSDPSVQHPVRLIFDSAGRPLLAWTESAGSGGSGSGWWARREEGVWQVHALSGASPAGAFSLYNPSAGAALALATNGTPFLLHAAANFASDSPYYLSRINLDTAPNGPGSFVYGFGGSRAPDTAFDADARASGLPDFVAYTSRGAFRLNDGTELVANPAALFVDGEIVFRQGPHREPHVVYQEGTQLHYNGGGPDRTATGRSSGSTAGPALMRSLSMTRTASMSPPPRARAASSSGRWVNWPTSIRPTARPGPRTCSRGSPPTSAPPPSPSTPRAAPRSPSPAASMPSTTRTARIPAGRRPV